MWVWNRSNRRALYLSTTCSGMKLCRYQNYFIQELINNRIMKIFERAWIASIKDKKIPVLTNTLCPNPLLQSSLTARLNLKATSSPIRTLLLIILLRINSDCLHRSGISCTATVGFSQWLQKLTHNNAPHLPQFKAQESLTARPNLKARLRAIQRKDLNTRSEINLDCLHQSIPLRMSWTATVGFSQKVVCETDFTVCQNSLRS